MDTVTHAIVGALVGKAFFAGRDVPAGFARGDGSHALSSPAARVAIVGCTLGAIFPDIDIFAGPLARNPLAIMEWHRNITHSAVFLPLWALLLAALSLPLARWLRWKSPPFWELFGIYAAGIGTHIFLDLMTSFGTMIWSPLRYSRPAWDWVFILDLTLTAIALVPQLAAWCYREPEKFWRRAVPVWAALSVGAFGAYWFAGAAGYPFPIWAVGVASGILGCIIFWPTLEGVGFGWTRAGWCRVGLAVLCVYIALAAAAHRRALAEVARFAAAAHLRVESLAALPLPPNFMHWVGLVSTPEGVWRVTFRQPGGAMEKSELYSDAQSVELMEQARKLRDVQIYLWFARYPIWRVRPREGDEVALEISDVRFFREEGPNADADPQRPRSFPRVGPNPAGFTFEVVFDAERNVISHGFKKPES